MPNHTSQPPFSGMTKPKVAIVVPCYNEERVIEDTISRLSAVLDRSIQQGLAKDDSFIILIDDGSQDQSWPLITKHCRSSDRIKGVRLSRNFGHQNALLAGISKMDASVDCLISIDADLQQDEGRIPDFLAKYLDGYEIVFGVRNNRDTDTWMKRSTATFFYWFMERCGLNIIKDHADYRLLGRKAIQAILSYGETNLFLRGLVVSLGFKSCQIHFDVMDRKGGNSKYTYRKMINFALDGITSFSVTPLRAVFLCGFFFFILSIFMGLRILVLTLLFHETVPGWASTVIPIYFFGGLQLVGLGLIGEYVGKNYLETKARPRFIIEDEML